MNPTPKPDEVAKWIAIGKDFILFVIGIGVIVHETFAPGFPSVVLLALAGAALGLPFIDFIHKRQNGHDTGGQ